MATQNEGTMNLQRLTLPLKRKNSNTSKNSKITESARHRASSRMARDKANSKYGRSEQSYLTFAPKKENIKAYMVN